MKRASISILLFILILSSSCDKENISSGTPACIRNEIKSNHDNWAISSVDEYFFQNRIVYAFSPDPNIITDGATEIKDEFCNSLCTVGGFRTPGANLCNGEDFFQTAVLRRNIWKK